MMKMMSFIPWIMVAGIAAHDSVATAQPVTEGRTTGSTKSAAPAKVEATPETLPGAEPFVYKEVGDAKLRLHVVKPEGWRPTDKRACMLCFFGGGWINGTPDKMLPWAKWAAARGMVGVAADYRTRSRFGTPPEDCVADGRAAARWIEDHADELGIDPARVVALGSSAGGHVAAWTAIPDAVSPERSAEPVARLRPAALVLLWPVTDTTAEGYGGPKRFGNDAERAASLSVTGRMPQQMPPTLVFHGTADPTVPYANSTSFAALMKDHGNDCLLIPFEGGKHSLTSSKSGAQGKAAKARIEEETHAFLVDHALIDRSPSDPPRP